MRIFLMLEHETEKVLCGDHAFCSLEFDGVQWSAPQWPRYFQGYYLQYQMDRNLNVLKASLEVALKRHIFTSTRNCTSFFQSIARTSPFID